MSLYYHIKKQLFPEGTVDFTPQFRLEGRARTADENSNTLAMPFVDTLYSLGRQWQFGEFQGEDNGSPISVKAHYHIEKITDYSLGDSVQLHSMRDVPLEARVEAMPTMGNILDKDIGMDLKSRVRIGQRFEKLIKKYVPKAFQETCITGARATYPLEADKLDATSAHFFRMMKGKVTDGGKLLAAIKTNSTPWKSRDTNGNKELREKVEPRLMAWYNQFYVQPTEESAWQESNLAHRFKVYDENEKVEISAPDYQARHLDWFSFDEAKVKKAIEEELKQTDKLLPINVSFPSMPNKRLFAFEDSKIDLTQMNIEPGELMKIMLLDFSLVSGSDWYTIPMKMELGECCWIEKIEVVDVFGKITIIENNEQTGATANANGLMVWDMFKIRSNSQETIYGQNDHFLFITPATTKRLESEALEELLFMRDEYANMVWAVEKRVLNGMGNPVDGYDQHTVLKGSYLRIEDDDNTDELQYKLASSVPFNWIPFLPKHANSPSEIKLVQAVMMQNGESSTIEPLSRLANQDITKIREEAIPKAGVRVQVTNQRVRWIDGKTYLWRGRKVMTGKGEGNSGLRFDKIK